MSSAGPTGVDRFTEHGRSVEELTQELGSSRTPRERAALAGRLLAVVGDLGRRQKAVPRPGVDRALRSLKREDLEGWLQSADGRGMQAELARASESAMEAAFADSETERREYATWAMEALARRDGLESALTALERWEAMGNALGAEGKRARERLLQELAQVEAKRPSLVRQLLAVNAWRRDESERLDPEQRERAWWYSNRVDCPPLALAAPDGKPAAKAAHDCDDCRLDRERAQHAAGPVEQHVTEAELWDLDLGTLSASRRRWIEKHARTCVECGTTLRALNDGDEPRPHAPESARPAPSVGPELLQAREEFKVLLFRDPRRARLVVEPVKGLRIAAARIDATWAGSSSPARAGASWEFDLGPAKAARGRKVALQVEIAGGVTVSVSLDL